jgi:hypothetical protein
MLEKLKKVLLTLVAVFFIYVFMNLFITTGTGNTGWNERAWYAMIVVFLARMFLRSAKRNNSSRTYQKILIIVEYAALILASVFENLNIFIVTGERTIFDIICSTVGLILLWIIVVKDINIGGEKLHS